MRAHRPAFTNDPSIGLHPSDICTLLTVLQRLIENGATVTIIEHDFDMIRNADHIIDLGPGGGTTGEHIVATGTPDDIANTHRPTGMYLT